MKYKMKIFLMVFSLLVLGGDLTGGEVITQLPADSVALTFDACETITPSYFDEKILGFLLPEKIPFTLFVSGKFALRNKDKLKELAKLDFVEIENHSLNHRQHMEKLKDEEIIKEVKGGADLIYEITGKKPKFFRFPAGNYDEKTLRLVENQNYKVVHWTFASGDPDKKLTPSKLIKGVLSKTQKGSILIFHINGRGYSTGEALPKIVEGLKKQGYKFVKLEEVL